MKLQLTAAEEAFQLEARAFINAHWAKEAQGVTGPRVRGLEHKYFQALAGKGWLVGQWPRELGGSDWSDVERLLWEQEAALAWAPPVPIHGADLLGPLLQESGTPQQKTLHLSAIASGEVVWCQAFVEDSGVLASERIDCQAIPVGSAADARQVSDSKAVSQDTDQDTQWVLSGTKPWVLDLPQGGEQVAAWFYVLAATSSLSSSQSASRVTPEGDSEPQLSLFLVDGAASGVTVSPRPMIGESLGQNAVHRVTFDQVRLPADALVGRVGGGRHYARQIERKRLGLPGATARNRVLLDQLKRYVAEDVEKDVEKDPENDNKYVNSPESKSDNYSDTYPHNYLGSDPDFQARLSSVEIELAGLHALEWRAWAASSERIPPEKAPEEAAKRAAWRLALAARAEPLNQQLADLQVEALGYFAAPMVDSFALDNEAPIGPEFAQRALLGMLSDRARSAIGAPEERLKTMIARSVLDLPDTRDHT